MPHEVTTFSSDATGVIVDHDPVLPTLKLNLGAGVDDNGNINVIPGFIPIDRHIGGEVYPLDYADGSVDEIRASHVLEHFAQNEVQAVLKHWADKLKPGGILKIAVPNLPEVFAAYGKNAEVPILSFIYGGQIDGNDYHKCGFDEVLLRELLYKAGLEGICKWESEVEYDCAHRLGAFSLNLMGRKPIGPQTKLESVGGILAAPRLSYTMHNYCTQRAMYQLQLECNIIQGCFWWTQLCEGMEKHLAAGKKYVLTLDYDSIFEPADVLELYRILEAFPDIDAVCALQSKRGGNEVLFSIVPDTNQTQAKVALDYTTTRIFTGHFGCTLFRASSLSSFPRPWMTPIPGKDGSWSEGSGRVDVDINFWHRWRDAGKSLHLANRVAIGHLEERVKWPSWNGDPIYQNIQDYTERLAKNGTGKPDNTWR